MHTSYQQLISLQSFKVVGITMFYVVILKNYARKSHTELAAKQPYGFQCQSNMWPVNSPELNPSCGLRSMSGKMLEVSYNHRPKT